MAHKNKPSQNKAKPSNKAPLVAKSAHQKPTKGIDLFTINRVLLLIEVIIVGIAVFFFMEDSLIQTIVAVITVVVSFGLFLFPPLAGFIKYNFFAQRKATALLTIAILITLTGIFYNDIRLMIVGRREILIIVTEFDQLSGSELEPHKEWEIILNRAEEEVRETVDLKIETLPRAVHTHDQARELIDLYDAELIIWGNVRAAAVEANYTFAFEVVAPYEKQVSSEFIGSNDELKIFVSIGGDTRYILNFTLASLLFYSGNEGEFLTFAREAIRLVPPGKELEMNVASIYSLIGSYYGSDNPQRAIFYSNRALEIDPLNVSYLQVRSGIYFSMGQIDNALNDIAEAIDIAPSDWRSYHNRGIIYGLLGEEEVALRNFYVASKYIKEDEFARDADKVRLFNYINRLETGRPLTG